MSSTSDPADRPSQGSEGPVEVDADRGLGAREDGRDLRRREVLLSLEEHNQTLPRRQAVNGGPETLDVFHPTQHLEGIVGGRGHLGEARSVSTVLSPGSREDVAPPAVPAPSVEGQVDQDAVEPCRKPRPTVESLRPLVETDKGLLGHLTGILRVAEVSPCPSVSTASVPLDQNLERGLVPRRDATAERLVGLIHTDLDPPPPPGISLASPGGP